VRSEIVVPLLDGACVLGVLDVDSKDLGAFGAEDRALLETVASYVGGKCRRGGVIPSSPAGAGAE
jgi:putative methionine-R-sulfoxide reductase with GAF domain